jgi:hypothetical protein
MKTRPIRYAYYARPLTEAEIAQHAPSVMNEGSPASKVTEKYSFFSTIDIVRDLAKVGWLVYGVEQRKVQKQNEERKDVTKHMVVFENPAFTAEDGIVPQIIMTNSHDGRNSFQFYVGAYNTIKKIGYVVDETYLEHFRLRQLGLSDSEVSLEEFRIKHQGYELNEVKTVVDKAVTIIPYIYEKINVMRRLMLTDKQKLSFATELIRLRWKITEQKVNLEEVLRPIREDEAESSLWNVMTTIQEKLVNGGVQYDIMSNRGKPRRQTARALANIDQKIEVKRSVWKAAFMLMDSLERTVQMQRAIAV